jgi:N-acetylglutamate synthase-like GNAT family acetyltransferase
MHNLAAARAARASRAANLAPTTLPAVGGRPRLSATHAIRPACAADAEDITALVNLFADEGLTLRRSVEQVALRLDHYLVAVDANGRVRGCAALEEYSPALGEVASVAVHPDDQGHGLGSALVQAVVRLAESRGISELFAMSLTAPFFESLGFSQVPLARYPEKLARYDALRRAGAAVREKGCFALDLV